MADTEETFDFWLKRKLRQINTDESIYGPYIVGILDGDGEEQVEEKIGAIEELLSGIIDSDVKATAEEIVNKWTSLNAEPPPKKNDVEDVDTRLARLLESNVVTSTVQRRQTSEESQIRSKILAQYSQVPVSLMFPLNTWILVKILLFGHIYQLSDEEDDDRGASASNGDAELGRNTNVEAVQQMMRERREQAKLESQRKKEKDKEDLKKQKQLREEKKEKRKSVKQERRR
ncbi:coiled-coil domain-containing protein 43 isoform X1 [Phlebotomus papatasi]|uniref:coiled-coil domain-containing protein 43 isoform X1 n=1 Tax=Phlebotomus papatasi TaxID=29031 RepID=UPI0024834983|nr:coiled-coil domain-containing protein 43 isoform X1 [Phlebotomus papatasi]